MFKQRNSEVMCCYATPYTRTTLLIMEEATFYKDCDPLLCTAGPLVLHYYPGLAICVWYLDLAICHRLGVFASVCPGRLSSNTVQPQSV